MEIPDSDRALIRAACPDAGTWRTLDAFFQTAQAESDAAMAELFQHVDESPYALSDWLSALAAFDHWLHERGISARPFETMVGYIHCVTLTFARTLSPPCLADEVLRALDQYGFEAVAKIDI